MSEDMNVSCYTTCLLLKYAEQHHLSDITSGIPVSFEHLNNPREWTTSAIWTALAQNLESALGNKPGILATVSQEILETEVNAFFPLFLKIAPLKILFSYLSKYTQQYSNKNLTCSVSIIAKNEIDINFQPIDPQQYSPQMCDFNRGWAYALAKIRGYSDATISEPTCSLLSNGTTPCTYKITWTKSYGMISRLKHLLVFSLRDQRAVISHIEQNHRELQQQYQEILSMRDFYSHIMDSMEEGILWLKPDRTISFTNNAFLELICQKWENVIGQKIDRFLQDPDAIRRFSKIANSCQNKSGTPIENEFIFACSEKESRYGLLSLIWVPGKHYQPGFVASIRNITDKKKIERQLTAAENRYRSLYENSPAIIVALNMNGNFIYANPAMTEQSGYSEKELTGMHFRDLIAPQADFNVDHLITTLLEHPVRLQEVHFKTKGGDWKCVALNTYHIHNTDGSLAGIAGIGVDVTETKRLNEQIIKSQRMDLLGQLAGGLAHDFGNILTSINGFSRMIVTKSSDEKIIQYAESISRSGNRAHDLIKNLLAFSRGDSRQSVAFNLNDIVVEVKDMLFGALPKMITVQTDLPEEHFFIVGDPGKIHQCILNLCMNARDAIGKRQGTISLRLNKIDKDSRVIQLQVEDSGCGIPPDTVEKIFDPFFSTKEKKEGTGLGLSVVYGIIKSHKGEITVESHPGEGTIFTLEFPSVPSPLVQ